MKVRGSSTPVLQPLMPRSPQARYGIAVLMAGVAVAARLALEPLWGLKLPLITFYPAIMVSAWLGGFAPGITTTVLCALAADYFWMSPVYSFVVREVGDLVALVLFIGVGGVVSGLNEAWRRAAATAAAASERLRITLTSIGDGVIATDAAGRITLMNDVAQVLTGWSETAALGRPLEERFVVVDEEARRAVENPVATVLREGESLPAKHTLLLATDGREIPIDHSAAPIRAADGRVVGTVMVFRNVTDRRRSERADERFRLAIEAAPTAIVLIDPTGAIHLVNGLAEQLFGYAREEIVGQPVERLVPLRFRGRHPEYRAHFSREPRRRPMGSGRDLYALRKDGSEVAVEIGLSPFQTADGAFVLAAVTDITARKHAEDERADLLEREQAARQQAETANRTKDQFLAALSHELRQPLTAMLGWLAVLRSQRADTLQQEAALDAIERSTRAQARMIDDLLDIARIEAGKMRLERRTVGLGPFVAEILDSLQHEAKVKGVALGMRIDPGNEYRVCADVDRLRQVVMNLLVNAIKYTPPGGRVHACLSAGDGVVRIVVTDTGIGIEPDLLPHVFERFRQADSCAAGTRAGLGLGLAIVRELVEMHEGTVEVRSDGRGRGATFTVTLPSMVA